MRIFVTGAAGFVGSHLAEALIDAGHTVVGCDNFISGSIDNVPKEVEFYDADCLDYDLMVRLTKNVELVYHCAALPYEGLSVFSPYLITKSIYCASVSVMTASIKNNVKRFVFLSSMARYGRNKVPFTENMRPHPQDPYGISKYAAELVLRNLCQVHGMEYVIAIPHNIYGPRQKYDDPFHNVVVIMINSMLQGKQPIIYGNGSQKRCFAFVKDLIAPLIRIGFEKGLSGEIFNLGPDEEFVSIYTLAKTIAELLNFRLVPIYVEGRPMEVRLANCSATRAKRILGFGQWTPLREGLKATIEYIRTNGPKPFKYHLDIELPSKKCPRTWTERMF